MSHDLTSDTDKESHVRPTEGTGLENALKAASTVAALQNERRQTSAREMALLACSVDHGPLQRAAQEFVAPLFAMTGSPAVERFEQARREYEVALQKASDEARLTAIAESNGKKAHIDLAIANHGKALDAVVAGSDASRMLLKSSFSIIPTAGLANFSSIEQPARNSAKFTLHSSRSDGYEEVAFHFIWGNTTNAVEVIDINAYLVLHGRAMAGSDGGNLPGIISGNRYSQLDLRARVAISLWSKPANGGTYGAN